VPVPRRSRISLRFVAGAIVFGILLGLAIAVLFVVLSTRGQPPRMSAADFEAARQRWRERGPASYDMDIEQSQGISGKIHVEVRSGRVAAMTINGEPAPERLCDNWSIPGLFEIIGLDLERNRGVAGQTQPAIFQQAEFDADTGLPRVYRRSDLESGQCAEWRIVTFRVRVER